MQRSHRAVAHADGCVGGGVDVGVGHDDHVVLGTAQGLHPFPVAGPGLIDVAGDRGAPDEGDGVDAGVAQQRLHRGGIALEHVEDPVGEARPLSHQLGEQQGAERSSPTA